MAMTTVIIAASATAISAASNAHDQACKETIQSFDAGKVNVPQMQAYAECVERIYPRYSEHEIAINQWWVGLALVAFLAGGVWGAFWEGHCSIIERMTNVILCALGCLCTVIAGGLIIKIIILATRFVFGV